MTTHLHDDLLEMYLREGSENPFVSELESHLAICKICSARLVAAATVASETVASLNEQHSLNTLERRHYARIATNEPATIQPMGPFSIERSDVHVLDISRGGMRMRSSRPLSPGTFVKLRVRTAVALCQARYCVEMQNGFDIGMLLRDLVIVLDQRSATSIPPRGHSIMTMASTSARSKISA
jgi:hypothetical protein